jgi:hypothetical protein
MHITPELEAELNAESIETAVDKVLDGIDAAKVRQSLIKAMKTKNIDGDSAVELYEVLEVDGFIDKTVDMLMQNFIITPRS